jgi:RNA polymerase sigma-70 factor (sigma-E family)
MDDGFRQYVVTRLSRLSRVAYLLTGDHHVAEDLLQSALVKVGVNWGRVAAADDPDAYVRRVLYHERVSTWRRRRRMAEHSVGDPPDVAVEGDIADDTVRRVVLERALARLTPKQRAVIVLRYFEDLSEVDAADALGCSVGTVKSQTNHALGRLRTLAPELAELIKDPTEVATWKG